MYKIAIHSVPRSGSTWLGTIFNSHPNVSFRYQPLFSYAFKDYLHLNSTTADIDSFFDAIKESDDAFINQLENIQDGRVPKFQKDTRVTHSCYKEVRYHHLLENMLKQSADLKLILLIRNPLAVLYSWSRAPKEFKAEEGWLLEEEWLSAAKKNLNRAEEYNGYLKWKESALLFQNLKSNYPNQVFLLNYQELLKNTSLMIHRLFRFVDLTMHEQTLQFIKDSQTIHQSDAYSVFKKRITDEDWKELPSTIIDTIKNDLKSTSLELYLNA
ncbi:sulfotransferase domain-containing protein [Geojedonia litorea]|uniref:Sulfotransferase domain-containing protein n=1 Tax=Geojedonia litorea TaxID=1268269 RepID=A0ABV9N334_9FLAO